MVVQRHLCNFCYLFQYVNCLLSVLSNFMPLILMARLLVIILNKTGDDIKSEWSHGWLQMNSVSNLLYTNIFFSTLFLMVFFKESVTHLAILVWIASIYCWRVSCAGLSQMLYWVSCGLDLDSFLKNWDDLWKEGLKLAGHNLILVNPRCVFSNFPSTLNFMVSSLLYLS